MNNNENMNNQNNQNNQNDQNNQNFTEKCVNNKFNVDHKAIELHLKTIINEELITKCLLEDLGRQLHQEVQQQTWENVESDEDIAYCEASQETMKALESKGMFMSYVQHEGKEIIAECCEMCPDQLHVDWGTMNTIEHSITTLEIIAIFLLHRNGYIGNTPNEKAFKNVLRTNEALKETLKDLLPQEIYEDMLEYMQ